MSSESISTAHEIDSTFKDTNKNKEIPLGLSTPLSSRENIASSPGTNRIINEYDTDCYTPDAFSQTSFISQSQEVIPVCRFYQQLHELSRSLLLSENTYPTTALTNTKLQNTTSRTSVVESLESTPTSSRRQSLEGLKSTESPSFGILPSRQELIHGIYIKLKDHLQEEINNFSNIKEELKTPAKLESLSVCPPLKPIKRRIASTEYIDTESFIASKRNFSF